MDVLVQKMSRSQLMECIEIWNDVVNDGLAFPQTEALDEKTGSDFFDSQSFAGAAIDPSTGQTVGLYILHPNNVGRCGHICNASFAVRKDLRGLQIGESLVRHCLAKARELEFKILQFNAVVADNHRAMNLYKKIGFTPLGIIPKGFLSIDGSYKDIVPHYIEL